MVQRRGEWPSIRQWQRELLSMIDDSPVSLWIDELKRGEPAAAEKIWQHFVSRLCDVARKKLTPATRRVYDEEDAAQSAFHSLCAGITNGRFPNLSDRESLWRLLVVITSRKVSHRHRYDRQACRDIGRTATDSVFQPANDAPPHVDLPSREPTPEFSAEFVDTCEKLFGALQDPLLHRIGQLKIEGYGDDEIAQHVGFSRRTVQRKIERIRRIWIEMADGQTP